MTSYPDTVELLKEHVFTFSFCRTEDIINPELWLKYGTVALNFEIVNQPDRWHEFRLSQMFYDDTPIAAKYMDFLNELQKKYPGWKFPNDYGSLVSLHAFHKESIHSYEKEYRILYLPPLFKGHLEQYFDFRVSEYHTGFTEYIELPLYSELDSKSFMVRRNVSRHNPKMETNPDSFPAIKIISVQFGDNEPKVDRIKLNQIKDELQDYLRGKFGYRIEVNSELFKTNLNS